MEKKLTLNLLIWYWY